MFAINTENKKKKLKCHLFKKALTLSIVYSKCSHKHEKYLKKYMKKY